MAPHHVVMDGHFSAGHIGFACGTGVGVSNVQGEFGTFRSGQCKSGAGIFLEYPVHDVDALPDFGRTFDILLLRSLQGASATGRELGGTTVLM